MNDRPNDSGRIEREERLETLGTRKCLRRVLNSCNYCDGFSALCKDRASASIPVVPTPPYHPTYDSVPQ